MSESADERKGPAVDPRILRRLWPFLRPHQRWVWLGFSCLMLGLGCRLAGPFLVKIAIDDHLAAGEPDGYGWIVGAFLGFGGNDPGAGLVEPGPDEGKSPRVADRGADGRGHDIGAAYPSRQRRQDNGRLERDVRIDERPARVRR